MGMCCICVCVCLCLCVCFGSNVFLTSCIFCLSSLSIDFSLSLALSLSFTYCSVNPKRQGTTTADIEVGEEVAGDENRMEGFAKGFLMFILLMAIFLIVFFILAK